MNLKNSKIMVVDDSDCFREMITDTFEHAGCEVISAENGEIALSHLNNYSPDVIVTDIDMPVMNGICLLKKVRAQNPDMKMLILTGYPKKENQKVANSYEVEILEKPVSRKILLKKIDNLLHS